MSMRNSNLQGMKSMKPYSKCKDILADLKLIIDDCVKKGVTILPSERSLSERLQTSRITLRKAIASLIEAQILYRKRQTTFIDFNVCKKATGSLLFFTMGENGFFSLPAFERLWIELKELARSNGIGCELAFYNYSDSLDDFNDKARHVDWILTTAIPQRHRKRMLEQMFSISTPVISLDQDMTAEMDNFICLDNYAVGQMAAEKLIEAGYVRPAFIAPRWQDTYIPFELRAKGFKDFMKKANADINTEVCWIKADSLGDFVLLAQKKINRLIEQGHDSVFVFSDESINVICSEIIKKGYVPEKFGVIAVDGSRTASRCSPTITAISHGTRKVAAEIISFAIGHSTGTIKLPYTTLVVPEIYEGMSVRGKTSSLFSRQLKNKCE